VTALNLFSRHIARLFRAKASPFAGISTKWLLGLFCFGLVIWPIQNALGSDRSCNLALQVNGGAHRIFRQGLDDPVLEITAWSTNGVAHDVEAGLDISDIFGWTALDSFPPIQVHLAADGSKTRVTVPLPLGIGYYAILVTLNEQGQSLITQWTDLGVVWPSHPGVRPDSFFSTNAAPKHGEDLQLLETVGIKVQRTHFFPGVATGSASWARDLPAGQAAPLDFSSLDRDWKETQAHGIWVLPVVGYSLGGAGVFDRTPLAERLGMYGPPNDNERFVRTWKAVLEHYPELTTIEFWNEPWIFGWTWAGTPEAYRQLQKQWCTMALALNPHYRLLAGSSVAFVRDELEPFPDCWEGLLQGVTDHPYTASVLSRNFRSGDVFRSIDEIRMTARDLGLPYAYLTEGGTAYQSSKPLIEKEPFNNLENAQKLVQYYAQAALAGVFMGNAQEEIGFGPGWTKSNTALATLTHFLEDRVPLVDLWPRQELLWGGIFADHKFITPDIKSLPRASELAARWSVEVPPDRAEDDTKVAVIWALTGQSARWLDTQGELVIANASDLRAYNMVGQEIPPSQDQLILPLSPSPVYITSDRLSVLELRDRIQSGLIRRLTPINFYALSLQAPASEKQALTVQLENQINRPLKGTLILRVAGIATAATVPFDVNAGELTEVRLPWPGHPLRPDNRYPIRLTARIDNSGASPGESFPPFSRDLSLAVSRFEKRTINLTGAFSDWNGFTPVTVDSDWIEPAGSSGSSLLNPNEKPNPAETESKRITGQVFTAYDDDFVYLGAAVHEAHFQCTAGQLFTASVGNQNTALTYPVGEPDGLRYVTECGNVFQFSFGFRDRVPGIGRQLDDPWAWKGAFYDADYSFVAHTSTQGDQLIRIWGPDTSRRNGYQTESVPGIGPVPGGTVKITRDESNQRTLYEIAIPRRQLMLFDPASEQCRFGFILYNGDQIGGGALAWSDAAGVFDYWQSPGSFPPTWRDRVACQTFFGIEP
jgi:hypothetical protein